MNRQEGIALIVSLVIMLVVAALGFGAMFLSEMNLRMAENTRTNVAARYQAETGLDTALVVLAREFRAREGSFPATKAEFESVFQNTPAYQLDGYQTFAGNEAWVRVKGVVTSRNAEYTTEARIKGVADPIQSQTTQSMDPRFGVGFVSNGTINFPGNSYLNLNVWSGTNVNFTGGQSRLAAGFWARAAGTTCSIGRTNCQTRADPPNVTGPNFAAQRLQIMRDTIQRAGVLSEAELATKTEAELTALLAPLCTQTLSGNQTKLNQSNQVICLANGTTLTLTGTASNVVVIGNDTTTVNLNANTVPGGANGMGVTIASRTIGLGHQSTTLSGQNTLMAKNDITFSKGVTSADNIVRTLIATEGDILLNGNGGRDIFATFWSKGSFRINGTIGEFIGTVVAEHSAGITGNGGVDDARLPEHVINPYVPTVTTTTGVDYTDAGIVIMSRR